MYRDRAKNPDYDPNATRSDGKPDTTSGKLAGDHSDPLARKNGSVADRLLHGLCNKQRGDGLHDEQRPALQLVRQQPSNLGDLVMGWPA
jgi:hypothetical protein